MESLISMESKSEQDIIQYDISINGNINDFDFSMPSVDDDFTFKQLKEINERIDFLTSDADKLDCVVAASSGILCAAIDSLLKEMRINKTFNSDSDGKDLLDFFNESGGQAAQKKVEKIVDADKTSNKAQHSIDKGNTLEKNASLSETEKLSKMVEFLEKRFNIPSDSFEQYFGGTTKHHLYDFAHHPSIVGLFFSMLTQFTKKVYGTDKTGKFFVKPISFEKGYEGRIARIKDGNKVYLKVIGETTKEKWFFGVVVWYYHLVSDIAGSSGTLYGYEKRGIDTLGKGAGIPGPLMSLAKALSALPLFNKKNDKCENENRFAEYIDKLYGGDVFKKIDENGNTIKRKVDYRTEKGLQKELVDQSIMVIVNEMVVRAFYFIRRFAMEIKSNNIKKISELGKIESKRIIPFGNRTIVRMMTISTGAFTATNLAIGAAVSAIKSGGEPTTFIKNFVMRINFVGVGRFFVAIGVDLTEGAIRSRLVNNTDAFESKQKELTLQVEEQTSQIMNDFAKRLNGDFEQGILDHLEFLGEDNEK